jgi:hypothetical protein
MILQVVGYLKWLLKKFVVVKDTSLTTKILPATTEVVVNPKIVGHYCLKINDDTMCGR